jgi:hypothetical protein
MANDERDKQVEKEPLRERIERDDALEKMERPAPWPDPPPPPKPKKQDDK